MMIDHNVTNDNIFCYTFINIKYILKQNLKFETLFQSKVNYDILSFP